MKKLVIVLASSAALLAMPLATESGTAHAGRNDALRGIIGGIIAGAVINSIVQANQHHCHGRVCHRHGYARAGHYHDAYGNIIYYQPAPPPPPPVYAPPPPPVYAPPPPPPSYGGYSQAHYNWCAAQYRSYDPGSNTYQPYGNVSRRQCVSPYR